MSAVLKKLGLVEASSALEVLKKIWYARGQFEHQPLLTLGINKTVITGWLCNIDLKSHDLPMVLSIPDANGYPSNELIFMNASRIEWISIRDSDPLLSILSSGAIDPLDDNDPPGKLQINRLSKEVSEQISSLIGKKITVDHLWVETTDDSKAMNALGSTLEAIGPAFTQIATDDFARNAMKEKFHTLKIALGDSKSVAIKEGVLSIKICPTSGSNGRYNVNSLKTCLNELL